MEYFACSQFGNTVWCCVPVIAKRTRGLFWTRHGRAETPLRVWVASVSHPKWLDPADVKTEFGATVAFVGDNRLIFDIAGNKHRLIMHFTHAYKRVLIRFVGSHTTTTGSTRK